MYILTNVYNSCIHHHRDIHMYTRIVIRNNHRYVICIPNYISAVI